MEQELPPARLPFPVTRTMADPVELRAEGDEKPKLRGRFTTFDDPYEVHSSIEGHFIERMAPGSFDRTIVESRKNIRVLFNHGQDPTMGDQILGPIEYLGGDARYVVDPLDGIPPLIRSGLEAGLYGSSHRFTVIADEWVEAPERSDSNPDGLPERTITEARLYEFGPVTFPANPNATAGIRSTTDDFYQQGDTYDSVLRSAQAARAPLGAVAPTEGSPQSDAGLPRSPEPDARRDVEIIPTAQESDTVTDYVSRDEKAARLSELKEIISRTGTEYPGVMPPDVEANWKADNDEHDQLVRDIAAWDERQARIAQIGKDERNQEPTYVAPTIVRKQDDIYDLDAIKRESRSLEEVATKTRSNALRALEAARPPKGGSFDDIAEIVEHRDTGEDGEGEIARRILLTGSPTYRKAFNKYLKGQQALWSPEESRAAALAVVGTTTTGGYAVPYVFDPTIYHTGVFTAQNPFRGACRVESITNGNNWRTVTVGAVTSLYVAEATAATEQGPTFGQPTYTVNRAHAFATVSLETLEDRPDIGQELTSVFAESKATYEENQFAVGVGTTVFPMGMFTDTAYTNQDTATNDVTAIADILVLEGALPLRYRANGAFFMNRSTIRQLQALDTTYRYFSGAGIQYAGESNPTLAQTGNTGLRLLGYPVWEVPSAVSTLTTDGAIIVVFCDPKSYIIVDRIGMNVEVIQNMLNGATPSFPTGQRGIYMYWRNTAKPIAADAGRSLSVQ